MIGDTHRPGTPERHDLMVNSSFLGRDWAECSCGWKSPDVADTQAAARAADEHRQGAKS